MSKYSSLMHVVFYLMFWPGKDSTFDTIVFYPIFFLKFYKICFRSKILIHIVSKMQLAERNIRISETYNSAYEL